MIQNGEAYAASDALVKGAIMGGYWYLINIIK